jgi:tetratricopeptide (TPR) repeat protein
MRALVIAACLGVVPAILPAQQTRMSSDFEIQQMERQAETARDFASQLSAHLNLGELHLTRNESALAQNEFRKALAIAVKERTRWRTAGDLAKYATATMYAGLAQAELGSEHDAFELLDEATRYAGDDAKTWNLYANAMNVLSFPDKAAAAALNAVVIAERDSSTQPIDLAIYLFTLASHVSPDEAVTLLESVIETLQSKEFNGARRDIARHESFEIYSSVHSVASAYISLLNRSQLKLAQLYEQRGETARARKTYQDVLAARSDDPTALAAVARLSQSNEERARYFIDAFDANPFSLDTIRAYEQWLRAGGAIHDDSPSPGARVRHAVEQIVRGERPTLDTLMREFPNNDTLRYLATMPNTAPPSFLTNPVTSVTPKPDQLRALLQLDLTPEQRVALDRITFTSVVTFNPGAFESGIIGDVPFKFSEPVTFAGSFPATSRLTYRILGVSGNALLLEPIKLEAP